MDNLIFKFSKPYTFENEITSELDLSGLDNLTGADLAAGEKHLNRMGIITPTPQMNIEYVHYMAHVVTGRPLEFFAGIPARDDLRLKNLVTGFLYGGDTEN